MKMTVNHQHEARLGGVGHAAVGAKILRLANVGGDARGQIEDAFGFQVEVARARGRIQGHNGFLRLDKQALWCLARLEHAPIHGENQFLVVGSKPALQAL